MRRGAMYLAAGLAALLLSLTVASFWLLGTTGGARFVLRGFSSIPGMAVSASVVRGRLWDHLSLRGLSVSLPQQRVTASSLEISWHPRELFRGRLAIDRLALFGVRVQDLSPVKKTPPSLAWPRATGLAGRVTAEITAFSVHDLSYRHLSQDPVRILELSARLRWDGVNLRGSELKLISPEGGLRGEIVAGFAVPSLRLDLAFSPKASVAGMDLFSLQARLAPGRSPEQMSGLLALAGRRGGAQILEVTGELGMTRSAFLLRGFRATMPGRRGYLALKGSVSFPSPDPYYQLRLQAEGLDLSPELKLSTDLSGTATFSGTPDRYRGQLRLLNQAKGWQGGRLETRYFGTTAGVTLTQVTGELLDGSITGGATIDWSPRLRLKMALAGRGLNPARFAPDWQGVVNLDLATRLELSPQGILNGSLSGELLESSLHGKALTGAADVAFAGKKVEVRRLTLAGKGFDLHAQGALDRRVELSVRVEDLSRLVPGAAGTLDATGWLRFREGLSGELAGGGRDLAASGVHAATASFSARLEEGEGYPASLKLSLAGVGAAGFTAQEATLSATGTLFHHELSVHLVSLPAEARLGLAGGYGDGAWRGMITTFSGKDRLGPWNLRGPATLYLSAERLSLSPFILDVAPSGIFEVAAEMAVNTRTGWICGAWSGIDLARANPFLQGVTVTGVSTGRLDAHLLKEERLKVSARVSAQGSLKAQGRAFEGTTFEASLEGGDAGVRANVALKVLGGEAHLEFTDRETLRLAMPRRGEFAGGWSGFELTALAPYLPAGVVAKGGLSGELRGTLSPGKELALTGNSFINGGQIRYRAGEDTLDLPVNTLQFFFGWRGRWDEPRLGKLVASLRLDAHGTLASAGRRLELEGVRVTLDAGEKGIRLRGELTLPKGATLTVSADAPGGATLALPETATLSLRFAGIDPVLFQPWLSGKMHLEGVLSGSAGGSLLPGRRLDLSGEVTFAKAIAKVQGGGGEVTANLRQATLSWSWRNDTLAGNLALELAQSGSALGRFEVPVAARLPVVVDPHGPLRASLVAKLKETGVLTSIFPQLIQESHGELDADLRVGGSWGEPQVEGHLKLTGGGGYLPAAGIRLTEVTLNALLEKELIRVDTFSARSGPGWLSGEGTVRLDGYRVIGYRGTLNGERFQTVYLPELQLLTSPRLTFQGGKDTLSVRGEVVVPEMLVAAPSVQGALAPSSDVVLEGAVQPVQTASPLSLDVKVRVTLGDKVLVKAHGIDARLGGGVDLEMKSLDRIKSRGEIRVVKGSYRAYGIDLEIERGRLYYAGGAIGQPTLDILALKKAGEVKAGVTVEGVLSAPVVKLYSEPTLPDVDILAYIVLGHPMGNSGEQVSMMSQAAGALFSLGGSDTLQDKIKERLGLNVLGFEQRSETGTGLMGYKEIAVSPTGVTPTKTATAESMLTVGKYITPKLYFSYGRSVVTGNSIFQLRYDIFRHWQIETQTGTESGADLYYKIEFQ